MAFSGDSRLLASASDDNTVKIWDATAYDSDAQAAREASGLVQFLFEKKLARTEAAVAIAADLTISEPLRKQALAWLDLWWASLVERDAERLLLKLFPRLRLPSAVIDSIRGDSSLQKEVKEKAVTMAKNWPNAAYPIWQLVSGPGRPDAEYREALIWAETASRAPLEDLYILRTLGVAQYRTGKYLEAAATLLRCDQERKQADPGDLAFLALAQYRLGQKDRARATLQRLQQAMKAIHHAGNRESQALLKEAEQTIGGGQIISPP